MAKRSHLSDLEVEKLLLESDDNFSDSSESLQDTDIEASESDFDSETSDNKTLLQQTVPSEFVHASSVRIQYLFSGNSDTVVPLKQNNVMSCLMCFVDDALCTMVDEQTNLYAEQFIASHPNLAARSRVHSWQNTTRDKVKTLIGMLVLQGILHKPDHKMYFSKRESVDTPFFGKVMSEKRFHLLLKFLHFADNTSYDPLGTISRKLFKIHPIMEHLRRKFRSVYMPERNITIEKSLLLWKGRLGWKQYIPSKHSRFGIKLYELCESSFRYVWDFIVYTGKDTNYGSHYPDEKITSRIVLELAHSLLGKGHYIYLDNCYSFFNAASTDPWKVRQIRQHDVSLCVDLQALAQSKVLQTMHHNCCSIKGFTEFPAVVAWLQCQLLTSRTWQTASCANGTGQRSPQFNLSTCRGGWIPVL
ncbi:piggyBac transposable element-derived protein 4-like [Schistocerca serialis cubense]|uniref:piggyBac transposable element-derived protein 4-like n=1 Tax=Schistocerca serialis cubense TaxID=2023355 RepID=UPI00214E0B4D|nr:piggyBac transposable element-derived protein 4-like [Schistocerca serialis cubense]